MERLKLEGQQFTRLTVKSWFGQSKWRCECSCGTQAIVTTGKLRSGHTRSCGCLLIDLMRATRFTDEEFAAHFWLKVEKDSGVFNIVDGEVSECWIWTGCRSPHFGYGSCRFRGLSTSAHRAAWIITNGELPQDTPWVLHKCDNPSCCRPSHTFLGDNDANMRDMVNKGRHAKQKVTHCPHGHEYSSANTRMKLTRGRLQRVCKKCDCIREQNRRMAARDSI